MQRAEAVRYSRCALSHELSDASLRFGGQSTLLGGNRLAAVLCRRRVAFAEIFFVSNFPMARTPGVRRGALNPVEAGARSLLKEKDDFCGSAAVSRSPAQSSLRPVAQGGRLRPGAKFALLERQKDFSGRTGDGDFL